MVKETEASEVRSGTSSEAEPDEDWESLSPRDRFLRKQAAAKKAKGGKSPKK